MFHVRVVAMVGALPLFLALQKIRGRLGMTHRRSGTERLLGDENL